MNNFVYCFYDKCSGTYLPQFFILPNDKVAMRSFSHFVESSNFPFKDIVSDLQVFQIGTFDVLSGVFNSDLKFICNLIDFVKKE